MKRHLMYQLIALILAVAILAQPFAVISHNEQAAQRWLDKITRPIHAEGLSDVSGSSTAVNLLTGPLNQPVQAAGNISIYLPMLMTPPGPPDFEIISPAQGWTVSGMMFFAVQPSVPETMSSVTFSAGSTTLGTDNTPADGYKAFFDASAFPAGSLTLTAVASGPSGQTTKSITVNVVSNPPSSGTIGSTGGVLASEIGSTITFPPGALPNGTAVSVDELTQQEVTDQTGIDWDAMGVTFLGAQDVQVSNSPSLPYRVASADFGNRVQPGQAVVNYQIIPDTDGDGIDELVVMNTASVAPNNDVISDPVPQILLNSTATLVNSSGSTQWRVGDVISGPPGTLIEIEATGLNPASTQGNIGIFRSLVDGTEIEIPVSIRPDPNSESGQLATMLIPPFTPGLAELTLRNESTGSVVGPMEILVETSPPLSGPAATIVEAALAEALTSISQIQSELSGEEQPVIATALSKLNDNLQELQNEIQQIVINPTPEEEQFLITLATLIENSNVIDLLTNSSSLRFIDHQGLCSNTDRYDLASLGLGALGIVLGIAAFFAPGGILGLAGLLGILSLHAGVGSFGFALNSWLCKNAKPCVPAQNNTSSGTGGMGSVLPPGGDGCGNVGAGEGKSVLGTRSILSLEPGRFVIKVFSSGSSMPFTGLTDAGGYFFVPLIPEGEPFTAIAFDTMSGETRTFSGIGPPIGESVFMFFDFISEEEANTVVFDEVTSGSIDNLSEIDTYTFSGAIGDQVLFRLARTAGNLDPRIQVYRPDSSLLCNAQTSGSIVEPTCTLNVSGTHTILVDDWFGDETGAYDLYLQRLNNPANATPVTFDEITPVTIDQGVDVDAFTFNGTVGDQVLFRLARTAGNLDPQIRVYRPDGLLLCNAQTSGSITEPTCALNVIGTYTILVDDWFGDETGAYDLYLQRLNNPANATPVTFDEITPVTIDQGVDVDAFTFSGTVGDQVSFRLARTAGNLDPQIRVYRPDGTLLCNAQTSGSITEPTCALNVTGTYTILVNDWFGDETGAYDLYLQRPNNPANPTPIIFDEILPVTISPAIDMDAFTFNGTVGDQVLFRLARTAGNLDPQIRVYRPDGTLLCNAQTSGSITEPTCALNVTGTYTILVNDWVGDETGTYDLYLQRLNNPANAVPIAFDEVLPVTISPAVDMDAFIFNGTVGDQVLFRLARTAGNLDPQIRVYRPDGTLLCNAQTSGSITEPICALNVSGTYTILVDDWVGDETGTYDFYLQRSNNPANPVSIVYGETLSVTINPAIDIDAITFNGTVGDQVLFQLTRTSGNLDPQIRVYRPDGSLLCNAQTSGAIAETTCALNITGTYTILVSDWVGDETGTYDIHIELLP